MPEELGQEVGSPSSRSETRTEAIGEILSITLEELLENPDAYTLRALRMLGIGIVRLRKGSWGCALIGDYDLWWLPAHRTKARAIEAAREILHQTAEGVRQAFHDRQPVPGVIQKSTAKEMSDVAQEMRRTGRVDRAARRKHKSPARLSKEIRDHLLAVRPFWPAFEAGDALLRIADEHDLPVPEIFDIWMEIHRFHPDDPLIVAEFESGRRVHLDGQLLDSLDKLIDNLLSESIQAMVSSERTSTWSHYFELFRTTLNSQVEYVTSTGMHEAMVLFALQTLLARDGRNRFERYLQEAFPHLKASSDRLASAISDAKRASVLVLGEDTDASLIRLNRICAIIEEKLSLSAILIKEQPELENHGLIGKLLIYATMARYVIVENSVPSGHLYELPYIRTAEAVTIVLQESGRGSSRMPDDSFAKNPLVQVFNYEPETLETVLQQAASWAENRLQENIEVNHKAWPWFQGS